MPAVSPEVLPRPLYTGYAIARSVDDLVDGMTDMDSGINLYNTPEAAHRGPLNAYAGFWDDHRLFRVQIDEWKPVARTEAPLAIGQAEKSDDKGAGDAGWV